jgi:Tol biopolymer transport system component
VALTPETRLGPYEILSALGAGGMGEVYKARDTRLDRDVAIKILPGAFAADTERVARFQREAKSLAALNHPNIAQIYGLEQAGDVYALVMELVAGEDLSERVARGAIPIDEALPIAKQIAEALEAAHEQGIIHRDLKPANIKVRADGTVKVLDFGLAKAMEPPASAPSVSQSPTLTTPAMTQAGMILGTAAYMSPEQAKGRAVDKRSDVWAFGCVLYEMLTGARAFQGDDVSDTLAAVLRGEPNWIGLPSGTPPLIRRLLRRCLEKDRKRRLDSAADARLEIEEALTVPSAADEAAIQPARVSRQQRTVAIASVAFVLGAVVMGLVGAFTRSAGDGSRAVARALISVAPADQLLGVSPVERTRVPHRPSRTAVVWSPNGQQLVFSALRGETQQLYLRALDRLDATPIAGTGNSDGPFFSPDGLWLGFWQGDELRKIPVGGGPTVPICKTPAIFGASWGANNTIVFARQIGGLWQVSANGGTPQPLTSLDLKHGEVSHRLPHILPDGKAVLFTILKSEFRWDNAQIVVRSLVTGAQTTLIDGGADARYVPTGHLIYARMGTLMAAPFDLGHLTLSGGAVGMEDGVMQAVNVGNGLIDTGAAQFSVSGSGALVYVPGGVFPDTPRALVWVDRAGAFQPLAIPPGAYAGPRLSPDGKRLALYTTTDRNVLVYDLVRGTLTHLTTEGQNAHPIWTPDGDRLVFDSTTAGAFNVFWKPADGSGAAERLMTSESRQEPGSWSPDKTLAFSQSDPTTNWDIWTLADHDRTPRPFVGTAANEAWPDFSPDGRWLAYASDDSGRYEIYVQPYPGPGPRHPISAHGGTQPAWARNGRELFYTVPDPNATTGKMMVVDVALTPTFSVGVPGPLESVVQVGTPTRGYDVSQDGRRFITVRETERSPEPPPAEMVLVQHWVEELKRRAPTK